MPKSEQRKNNTGPAIPSTTLRPELAHLPAAIETLRKNGFESMTEAGIFCAVLAEETTIATIVKKLKLPFSTVSRVAYALEQRGLLTYTPHPTDRRKKLVHANLGALQW